MGTVEFVWCSLTSLHTGNELRWSNNGTLIEMTLILLFIISKYVYHLFLTEPPKGNTVNKQFYISHKNPTSSNDRPVLPPNVCTLACMIGRFTWGRAYDIRISHSFPGPGKTRCCHTLGFNHGILTSKWEHVLGKYRGYWFSQSKPDHVKRTCLESLCLSLLMGVTFIRDL